VPKFITGNKNNDLQFELFGLKLATPHPKHYDGFLSHDNFLDYRQTDHHEGNNKFLAFQDDNFLTLKAGKRGNFGVYYTQVIK